MGGAALGVWVAHGEGRALFPHAAHLDEALARGLAPLRYVDDNLAPTEVRALLYTTPSRVTPVAGPPPLSPSCRLPPLTPLPPLTLAHWHTRTKQVYPMNPNGSPRGVAGLCSEDGRHLAMMPHPERCVKTWQWPHLPPELKVRMGYMAPYLAPYLATYLAPI